LFLIVRVHVLGLHHFKIFFINLYFVCSITFIL
jgi:hypothetical protein